LKCPGQQLCTLSWAQSAFGQHLGVSCRGHRSQHQGPRCVGWCSGLLSTTPVTVLLPAHLPRGQPVDASPDMNRLPMGGSPRCRETSFHLRRQLPRCGQQSNAEGSRSAASSQTLNAPCQLSKAEDTGGCQLCAGCRALEEAVHSCIGLRAIGVPAFEIRWCILAVSPFPRGTLVTD
jgi:hypothetical protein